MQNSFLLSGGELLQLRLARAVEQAGGAPSEVGVSLLQVVGRLLDRAAARGGEGDERLALQVVALNESVDDGRGGVPLDGETDVDHIIVCHLVAAPLDGGAEREVVHLHRRAGVLVVPVKVGRRVGRFRFYPVKVGTGHFSQLCGNPLGRSRGGEISN